ncbi:hypothetical protein ABZT04_39790 [Streptomyces sp. NPDC005492]|uniref:hypothetical protein n=1 Tax=Streptomyces sp. NPDC005492 TaxID=3156883 RepID=UPI0033B7CE2C
MLLEIDRSVFRSSVPLRFLSVEFPDVVPPDPGETAQQLNLLNSAGAISTYEKVRRLKPDWRGEKVLEEVARIKDEQMVSQPPSLGINPSQDAESLSTPVGVESDS